MKSDDSLAQLFKTQRGENRSRSKLACKTLRWSGATPYTFHIVCNIQKDLHRSTCQASALAQRNHPAASMCDCPSEQLGQYQAKTSPAALRISSSGVAGSLATGEAADGAATGCAAGSTGAASGCGNRE